MSSEKKIQESISNILTQWFEGEISKGELGKKIQQTIEVEDSGGIIQKLDRMEKRMDRLEKEIIHVLNQKTEEILNTYLSKEGQRTKMIRTFNTEEHTHNKSSNNKPVNNKPVQNKPRENFPKENNLSESNPSENAGRENTSPKKSSSPRKRSAPRKKTPPRENPPQA